MADIRKIVQGDRGLLKKFQAFIPGYKKYRNCEDLRVADDLLRREIGKELAFVEKNIEVAREFASKNMDLAQLTNMGELVNISHRITKKVIHAEQGYAPWISGDVRFEEDQIKALYDYDLALFKWMDELRTGSDILGDMFRNRDSSRSDQIITVRSKLEEFEEIFDARISEVTRVAQEK